MNRTTAAFVLCSLWLVLLWPAGNLLAYRDLETGTFLTRDPAGMVDGPNLYTYVNQNPWTKFDPEGLQASDQDIFIQATMTPEERQRGKEVLGSAMKAVGGVAVGILKIGGGFLAGTNPHAQFGYQQMVNPQASAEEIKLNTTYQLELNSAINSLAVPELGGERKIDIASEPAEPKQGVKPYQVGTKRELDDNAFVGDQLQHDHQPSYASLVLRFKMQYKREPTALEAAQIYEEGIAMVIPEDKHRQYSPTYGARNNKTLQLQDAQNPQAAYLRDSQAQINVAEPSQRDAARKAQAELARQQKEKPQQP